MAYADVTFANPLILVALGALPLLALLVLWIQPERLRGGVVLSTVGPLARIGRGGRARWRRLLLPLRLAGLGLLIVALARPQTAKADATIETEGIDIVLAYDISGSMNEEGLGAPTKLEAAKRALKQFITTRENDKVGLVVFKSESRVMSPLTLDYTALAQMVDEAERQNRDALPEGTGIGVGITDAVNLLRNSRSKTRIIIAATDGQNNNKRIEPVQAAQIAETLKMRLYLVGMVTANTRIESTLDERSMRQWAESTGGSYTRAVDEESLSEIIGNIANLEKTRFERERLTRYNELSAYFLIPGLALLLLEIALGATLLRRAP